MFPFRTSAIFRSRWIALLWAGGVLWTAVSLVPAAEEGSSNDAAAVTDATGAPVNADQAEALLRRIAH